MFSSEGEGFLPRHLSCRCCTESRRSSTGSVAVYCDMFPRRLRLKVQKRKHDSRCYAYKSWHTHVASSWTWRHAGVSWLDTHGSPVLIAMRNTRQRHNRVTRDSQRGSEASHDQRQTTATSDGTGRATTQEPIRTHHDTRDRHDSWDHFSEPYHERNVNADWNASWCYVQSGFDRYQDSLVAEKTRKRIECNLTHDEDNFDAAGVENV